MSYDESKLVSEKTRHEGWISQQQGVTGVGIGLDRNGQKSIKVYTDHMTPETRNAVRSHLQGVPVDFEETGEFKTF